MHTVVKLHVLQAGGVLRKQTVNSLTELADYDLMVNCGGLLAGKMFDDNKVVPVRCKSHLITAVI